MNNKIAYILFILLMQYPLFKATAQSGYRSAGTLYRDKFVAVELQYKLNDPCASGGNGKPSKYRFVITGKTRGYDHYINWWMEYYNCYQSITIQSCSLNISKFETEGVLESLDWTFDGNKLEKDFYEVIESSTPLQRPSQTKPVYISTAPSSITGNTNLSYGEYTTLSVKGGSLGRDAAWKWYVGNCAGKPVHTGESLTVNPEEDKTYSVRAESTKDTSACVAVHVKVAIESEAADHIEGKKIICRGEPAVPLTVSGGKLGKGAEWVWYQDSIATASIGKGKTIYVTPGSETVYWVRAESNINITTAKNLRVTVVNEQLKDPNGITGNTFVCKGSALELRASGGQLTANASWCWYKNTVSPGNLVTKGAYVTVYPEENTVYILRGEGVCSNTGEKRLNVITGRLSVAPQTFSAAYDPNSKRKIILTVSGGSLGEKAGWVWYKGGCEQGNKTGSGQSIKVKINKKTVYYVRAVGECNTTTCISRLVYPRFAQKYTFINFGIIPSFNTLKGDIATNIKNLRENPVVSLTFGKLAETGWYARGKYSIKSQAADYTVQDNSISDYNNPGNYYVFNGNKADNRLAFTIGYVYKMNNSVYILTGIGYGKRDLMWGVSEYATLNNNLIKESWGRNTNGSFSGVEIEATLLLRISFFNIALGINGIAPTSKTNGQNSGSNYKIYGDGFAGIGISF